MKYYIFHYVSVLLLLIAVLVFLGCTSFPQSKDADDSLLIIFLQSNDSSINNTPPGVEMIHLENNGSALESKVKNGEVLVLIPVQEGSIRITGVTFSDGSVNQFTYEYNAEITASSVFLFPFVLNEFFQTEGSEGPLFEKLSPEYKKQAAGIIENSLDFRSWKGKKFIGFSPYTPGWDLSLERTGAAITTIPAGADIIIDGEDWGKSPLDVNLTAEKHLIFIRKEGFESLQTFINLGMENSFSFTLKEALTDSTINEKSKILCLPFTNLGDPSDDNMAPVFADSIGAGLYTNKDIDVTIFPWNLVSEDISIENFIKLAEGSGSQMLVVGNYRVSGGEILVQASLIDVQTELVKTSLIFPGKAGIEVFDSIDTMTEEFLGNFSKVLPEVGKRVVTRQGGYKDPEIEKQLSDLDWIASRSQKDRSIELGIIWGATIDEYENLPMGYENTSRSNGPVLGLNLACEKFFRDNISLVIKSTPTISPEEENMPLYYTIPLIIEPRLTFTSLKTETYIGISGSIAYSSEVTIVDNNGLNPINRGPYLYFNMDLDTGIKIYINKNKNARPTFLSLGFYIPFTGTRVMTDFSDPVMNPFSIWFTLTYGRRF